MLKSFQPTFSAALAGHVEASGKDDKQKNELCQPVIAPKHASDWLRMMATSMANQARWSADADLMKWTLGCRLDPLPALMRSAKPDDQAKMALLTRVRSHTRGAFMNVQKLMAELRTG